MILLTFLQIFDRTKIVFWKIEEKPSKLSWNVLAVKNEASERSKILFLGGFFADLLVSKCPTFEYNLFHFFAIIWVTKLKSFSRKVWQSVQIGLNLNFARGTIFESGFEATLKWKANTVTVSKWCFSFLCKFFSDKVKTIF